MKSERRRGHGTRLLACIRELCMRSDVCAAVVNVHVTNEGAPLFYKVQSPPFVPVEDSMSVDEAGARSFEMVQYW